MHLTVIFQYCESIWMVFQFPLLGIFPCTLRLRSMDTLMANNLSIPVTWDFSMHLSDKYWLIANKRLSIPVTWDFSMHRSLASVLTVTVKQSFQFPLLGIFPCTITAMWNRQAIIAEPFNSRYLGFFHAPIVRQFQQRS